MAFGYDSALYLALCAADVYYGMLLPFVDRPDQPLPEERLLIRCVSFELTGIFLGRCLTLLNYHI